jgi:hypothetical protein
MTESTDRRAGPRGWLAANWKRVGFNAIAFVATVVVILFVSGVLSRP